MILSRAEVVEKTTTRIAFSLWRKQFTPPPSLDTARRWAAAGTIQLWQATPHARVYVIDERTAPVVTADDLVAQCRRPA